jgi:hypothetical protein
MSVKARVAGGVACRDRRHTRRREARGIARGAPRTAVALRARVKRLLLVLLSCAAPACAIDDAPATDEVTAPDDLDKADAAAELRVRAADTTLWAQPIVARRGDTFYVHARTSRDLAGDGTGFVFDDPYGAYAQVAPRTFEVAYDADELGPLADGVDLFVGFAVAGHDHLTARAVVRPRLVDASGSSRLAFTATVTPIVVDGTTVFRVRGRATGAVTAIAASAGTATQIDATHVTIDLSRAELVALAGTAATLDVTATVDGATVTRRAHVAMAIASLGLTSGDAYARWPAPTCTAALRSCLAALPPGALDASPCGDAVTTRACEGQVGAVVDGPAITQAMAATDARLADPAFASDAAALAGADHAAALATALRARVQDAVNARSNRWYLSTATRDARLAAAVDATFDRAYARPLELVPAHAPIAGDADRTRDVAADALLAYLATQDYTNTDFGRSYDQLTKDFRAQHVADLRDLRTPPDDIDPEPGVAIYLGSWLGTHVEVTIDTATGNATHVLVELD